MRIERAYARDYNVEKHYGPGKLRFAPLVKLDLSQIRDARGKTPRKAGIGTYMSSVLQSAKVYRPPTVAERTTQFRARERLLKPYRRLHIGAMRVRGK